MPPYGRAPNAFFSKPTRVGGLLATSHCENHTVVFICGGVVGLPNAKLTTAATNRNLKVEDFINSLTVNTLRFAAHRQAMSANYASIMNNKVFSNVTIGGKEGLKFRRILLSEEANMILDIIWKESEYVTKDVIIHASYKEKTFISPITSYSLGVRLASNKDDVAATVTRVRNITIAGSAYGLIDRQRCSLKSVPIQCTSLLNDVMLEIGSQNSESGQQFGIHVGWTADHLPQRSTRYHNWKS